MKHTSPGSPKTASFWGVVTRPLIGAAPIACDCSQHKQQRTKSASKRMLILHNFRLRLACRGSRLIQRSDCGWAGVSLNVTAIFIFSLVSRMQTLSLNIIENMFRANDIFVKSGSRAAIQKRMNLLSDALSNLKLLAYLAFLSDEQNCILSKQYEHLSKLAVACQKLLEAWIASHHALLSRSCTK